MTTRQGQGRQVSDMQGVVNALTVDVEDYFQVSALAPHIPRESWSHRACRVERNLDRILALFERRDARATFFTLGWIAERYPAAVRRIVECGHELASHGYGHERVSDLGPAQFHADITRAKALLEDIGGVAVKGYRAPSFSIGRSNLWALEVLAETGHRYSSSIYPVRHDHYGMPEAPRHPHRPTGRGGILELPPATLALAGRNLPAAGGGYFRLLPYAASRGALNRINRVEGQPAVFYFHPWEIDPGQPRIPGIGLKTRFRHYLNLHRMEARLERLLHDFRWDRMDQVYASALAGEPQQATPPAAAPELA
ncbi:XrtA system polysaccharide deacetylase [Alkalilimnicola ehrlichii MLHE-1]|uniref:Polysaccharide deacetylase n=1 Tax=Alkalilimnicola ehrlichii (strain ATCC BAA-1101 / DSM 17681 / MLHE-1) TaxID=187272 RepID=Q0ACD9_ALKEH|nr:XrtA system polysaccharide deacetylase [Alkalilimnicola ehrlichii]ABI55498.1 polysaccharide deacetylase [Alkalilimnicola ehrlichii MLHE-1]